MFLGILFLALGERKKIFKISEALVSRPVRPLRVRLVQILWHEKTKREKYLWIAALEERSSVSSTMQISGKKKYEASYYPLC